MPAAAAGAHAPQAVAMRVSHKMWLLMGLAACLVVAQYHVSTTWLQSPLAGSEASSEEVVRAALDRLRHAPHRLPAQLVHELARELGCSPAALGAASAAAPTTSPSPSPPPPPPPQPPQPPPPPPLRTVYVITPTYRRPEQLPELTRMAQTLMHVPALHWLVIEDAARTTPLVTELLARSGIPYDHLVAPMPEEYKKRRGAKPRGVSNRNRGLQWIRANATTGVLYFADDDNTYDIHLFEEMRSTERVAMWPVGLCTKYGLSTPVVVDGRFKGFYDGWVAGRKFPVDMAGFAVSVEFLLKRPKASMPYKPGFEEDGFLKSLAPFEPHEIELKANNCTKVLVWHTQTKKNEASAPLDMRRYNNTNLILLKKIIV